MVKHLMCISALMLQPMSKEKMGPTLEVRGCNGGWLPQGCPLWPSRQCHRGGGELDRTGAGQRWDLAAAEQSLSGVARRWRGLARLSGGEEGLAQPGGGGSWRGRTE
jgi:hypothetical protein